MICNHTDVHTWTLVLKVQLGCPSCSSGKLVGKKKRKIKKVTIATVLLVLLVLLVL